jgi:DNA-binding transcriptional ArsR family regulator
MLNIADVPAFAPIESLEAMRAVADTQRHKILFMLIEEPLTPTAIAQRLDIARTRVYYHLDILKKYGFIAVVEERPVAAMVERTYRALARTFKVDRRMLSATAPESAIDDAQAVLLEMAAEDLRARPHAGPSSPGDGRMEVLVARAFMRLSPADAVALRADLSATYAKYQARTASGGDDYEYVAAFFPTEGASS